MAKNHYDQSLLESTIKFYQGKNKIKLGYRINEDHHIVEKFDNVKLARSALSMRYLPIVSQPVNYAVEI